MTSLGRRAPDSSWCPLLSLALGLVACSSSDSTTDSALLDTDPSGGASSTPAPESGGAPSASNQTPDTVAPPTEPSQQSSAGPSPGPVPRPVPPNPSVPDPTPGDAGGSGAGGATPDGSGGRPSENGGETPSAAGGVGGEPTPSGSAGTSESSPEGGAPSATGGSGGTPSGGAPSSEGGSGGVDGPPPGAEDAPCQVPDFIFEDTVPIGWASQSGGTTGGGSTAPVLVTSLAELQDEVQDDTPKVIYVQGDFAPSTLDIGSNKTLIGCSAGAHIRGHISIGSGSSNLILRNLEISGYGAGDCSLDPDYDAGEGCSSGNDAVSVNGNAHHVWFDHCSVKDGTDGNLDITNDANFVTVSWTKFSYTPRRDDQGNDSTGASGHRYSNLVGGSDSKPTNWPNTIPLNVTWHHDWWGENVVERQPRVRYGRNHLFNNYYDSNTSNYCVRAGIEASILLEANYFDGVDTPHEFNNDNDEATAFIALGNGAKANVYDGTSGEEATGGGGDAFTPPYEYAVDAADTVPEAVKSGAGPH